MNRLNLAVTGITIISAAVLASLGATGVSAAALAPAHPGQAEISVGAESAVSNLAARSFGAQYGGMAVVGNQRQIAVYLTDPTPAIERAFDRVAPAGTLVFRKTPRSMRQLNAIQSSLQGRWSALRKSGLEVEEFGSNPLTGKEDIGVVNLTASQATELDHMYGAQAVNVFDVTPQQADSRQVAASRIGDTAPFNGGDAIMPAAHNYNCSTGFGIVIGGASRLLTAGHCFTVGTSVYNGRWLGGTTFTGSNAPMGTVIASAYSSQLDAEVMSGSGSDLIWTGPIGDPQRATVSGVGTWAVGDQVCTSGANGGEICGLTVEQVNYCVFLSLHYDCHLTRVHGSREIVPGDSGGPVFRFSGNSVTAVGIVSGFDSTNDGNSYFTGIYAILSQWGASLQTG
jgi:trypsin